MEIANLRDKLEWVTLGMMILILIVAVYRYLLNSWRSEVNLREYPSLRPTDSRVLNGSASLVVDVPGSSHVKLELLNASEKRVAVLFDQLVDSTSINFDLDTKDYADGTYYLRLTSEGQRDTRRIKIENAQT